MHERGSSPFEQAQIRGADEASQAGKGFGDYSGSTTLRSTWMSALMRVAHPRSRPGAVRDGARR
jgi:hypothetical protein